MKRIIVISLTCFVFLTAFVPNKTTRIFLAGDSTISIKPQRVWPETGWGMPFATFWDSTIEVRNKAMNGRSTKTFILEGRWQNILDEMQEGDYVLIQFGHNDESVEKKERYTPPDSFQLNLRRFVNDVRAKKGFPVLLTPVSRRRFKDGNAIPTHEAYSPLVKKVADDLKVPFIDLDTKSRELYQRTGESASKLLFLQLEPGEHPNYPEGKNDNTHFSELGARLIAQIVLAELKSQAPALISHIHKP
ncbi:MAG: rhamnogalacturonan acetylesterase [Chitinophagaceae bacterium]|nr:rhamnogalacturonan acetylesterase [Chitinophagaceae bacterium]